MNRPIRLLDFEKAENKKANYGVDQTININALQQAMFAMGMGDEEEDEKRVSKTLNGMLDSQLRGLGIGGQ